MITIINKWVFPIVAAALLGLFYITDPTAITPGALILTAMLTFLGISVTERLDKIIEQKDQND
jgi:hypothetical protein